MKKVFLDLLLVVVSFSAKAQTTEKTDDMDRIEAMYSKFLEDNNII